MEIGGDCRGLRPQEAGLLLELCRPGLEFPQGRRLLVVNGLPSNSP